MAARSFRVKVVSAVLKVRSARGSVDGMGNLHVDGVTVSDREVIVYQHIRYHIDSGMI